MKIQCPSCKKVSTVPDAYRGRRVKCKSCKESFVAEACKKPPIVVPMKLPPLPRSSPGKENFVTKLWTRTPSAFRTSFLATLGVVSALWVSFNFIGPGTWLRRPSAQKTFHTSPVLASLKKVDTGDIDFLAATIRFSDSLFILGSLQRIRNTAAEQLGQNGDWTSFFSVLRCTQIEVEDLYFKIRNSIIPDNPDLQAVYKDILAAVDAEYLLQKKMMGYLDTPKSLRHHDLLKQGENVITLRVMAALQLTRLFDQVQEGLLDALLRIDGDNK